MADQANHSVCKKKQDDHGHKMKLRNPNISTMPEDVLYHFALGTKSHDLKAMFGDLKFVCIGGSPRRMESFAHFMLKELNYDLPAGQSLINIARATDRYAMYKVGPVLAVSHGMGIPSVAIMLHEVIKLVYHAQCDAPEFFRVGTCGGLGLEPGTVVVTEAAVDALLRPHYEVPILGKLVRRPAELDRGLVDELCSCAHPEDDFSTIRGKTMCTLDFYEGQARLDGAFCDYTEEDKMSFLHNAYEKGIRNMEMESLCFAAMCQHANIKGGVACVTLLDRLKGDQIITPQETLKQWDERPAMLVARLIRKKLGIEE